MNDFLAFRRMITPLIIQVLFWIGIAVCVIAGVVGMLGAGAASGDEGYAILGGLVVLVVGPVIVRVYCEILMVVFRINETLTDIRANTARSP